MISTANASALGPHVWVADGIEGGNRVWNRDGTTIAAGSLPSTGEVFSCPVSVGAGQTCGSSFMMFFAGTIGEMIVYSAALSTAERQFVEGYLACKWGIQSQLPTSHPYYAVCPGTANPSVVLVLSITRTGNPAPGTVGTYTTTYANSSGTLAYNPMVSSPVPAHTDFQIGSMTSNAGNTGLSYAASYSSDGGSTWTYVPVSGGGGAPSGYDRNVTNVRWNASGALGCGSGVNSGSVAFAVQIQ
jgi:uncharacterized repeat protein (TIGR01451 family)